MTVKPGISISLKRLTLKFNSLDSLTWTYTPNNEGEVNDENRKIKSEMTIPFCLLGLRFQSYQL